MKTAEEILRAPPRGFPSPLPTPLPFAKQENVWTSNDPIGDLERASKEIRKLSAPSEGVWMVLNESDYKPLYKNLTAMDPSIDIELPAVIDLFGTDTKLLMSTDPAEPEAGTVYVVNSRDAEKIAMWLEFRKLRSEAGKATFKQTYGGEWGEAPDCHGKEN